MTELLLPRLKQEIEERLAELRPLIAEIEQLEAAKAALLAGGDGPAAAATRRAARPARRASGRRAAAKAAPAKAAEKGDGERAPRGANRDAILKVVDERPGVSVAEIASVTKIAKPTVATTVSKLKREGVLADEAGGVKLASRQALTLSGPAEAAAAAAAATRDEGASDAEWDEAAPAAGDGA
jgi:DNA-binding transcriptional ArsR family regulator